MKFGVGCGISNAAVVKNAGYDYIEPPLKVNCTMSEQEFGEACATLKETGIAAEVFNGFFPGDMALVGDEVDIKRISEHAKLGLYRAACLGGKIAVIGSGPARNIPEGFDAARAKEQFMYIVNTCADIAAENGIRIVVEPLNKSETNYINTVADGIRFVHKLGNPNVGCMADLYHMYREEEDYSILARNDYPLIHVHLARPNDDRRMPEEADMPALEGWAKLLKENGYDARISLEGSFKPEFEETINQVRPRLNVFCK